MTPGDLTTADLTKIAAAIIFVIVLGSLDDPRAWNSIKARWSNTVGAWFARRRERKALGRPAPGWRNFKTR